MIVVPVCEYSSTIKNCLKRIAINITHSYVTHVHILRFKFINSWSHLTAISRMRHTTIMGIPWLYLARDGSQGLLHEKEKPKPLS